MRLIILLACISSSLLAPASNARASDMPSSHEQAEAVVGSLITTLSENYVFHDKAKDIAAFLRDKAERGGYDTLASKEDLARTLTDDLIKASGDLHFAVGVDAIWVADYRRKDLPGGESAERQRKYEEGAKTNFGFDGISRLEGNVGYLNLAYFADPSVAYDTAAAAMRMLENSDALIIDLRYNNGGYLEMAQFIASYFFLGDKDKLLFDYYYYDDGKRVDRGQWVLPALPGKRMVDKPVYILTGSTSFSAAEWFTYTMKKIGRAKVIGARTAGGAHPIDRKPIDSNFYLQVPIGQIRDPVDRGDFEGVGVLPDVDVPSINALAIAQKIAIEGLMEKNPAKREELDWDLVSLNAKIDPVTVTPTMIRAAVGKYEGRMIGLDHGHLYYIWRDRFRAALVPISPGLFDIEGVSDFRYRLVSKAGRTTGLERVNRDGSTQFYKRL